MPSWVLGWNVTRHRKVLQRMCGLPAFQACNANPNSLDLRAHRQALGDGCSNILEVSTSRHNNHYLLVIQDYMTKWVEAITITNQTAVTITKELIAVFCQYGIPDILHSDQGRNFESTILKQTLDAFGVAKSQTTAYHPAGDGLVECFNRSLLQMLHAYVDQTD